MLFIIHPFKSRPLPCLPSKLLASQQAVYKAFSICLLLTSKFPASHLTLSPTVILSLAPAELGLIYISLANLI